MGGEEGFQVGGVGYFDANNEYLVGLLSEHLVRYSFAACLNGKRRLATKNRG